MSSIVVNLLGGPGIGKTTVATELFTMLKKHGVEAECPGEFAHECVLTGNASALQDQAYILGTQYHRILCASQHAAVTIVDSPILLCAIYGEHWGFPPTFASLVVDLHNQFHNLNIVLDRAADYRHTMTGRAHSLTESIGVDRQIVSLLDTLGIPYVTQQHCERHGESLSHYITREILEYLEQPDAAMAEQ